MPERAEGTADPGLCRLMGAKQDEQAKVTTHEKATQANREWFSRRLKVGGRPYAIELDGRYIGDIDFATYYEEGKADLTFFIGDRREWGRGYGTEAARLIIEVLFELEGVRLIGAQGGRAGNCLSSALPAGCLS